MFGTILGGLWKATKSVAAGRTQADLGIQSPHLPQAIVRVGRFLYTTSGLWILGVWYSGFVNMRTEPGSGPKLILGGHVIGNPDRPDRNPKFSGGTTIQTPGGPGANTRKSLPGGGKAAGFLPRNATYKPGRADQGRDGQTDAGGAIIAPGDGVVVRVASDPNGFGPNYPIVRFTSGPYRGQDIYVGHTHSALAPGTKFRKDEILSFTGKTPVGNASVPGWFEIGYAPGGNPGRFGQSTPF